MSIYSFNCGYRTFGDRKPQNSQLKTNFNLNINDNIKYMILQNQRHLDQYIYFEPYYCFYASPVNLSICLDMPQSKPSSITLNQDQIFEEFLAAQLQVKHRESYIKQWTQQEDQKLLLMGKQCRNWRQLSKKFDGKSAKVCHRRYRKLLRKEEQWPKEDQETIKRLKEVQNKSWVQIEMIMKKYNAKKIRERYKNYLEFDVSREKWTLEEDLELWRQVTNLGRAWSEIAKIFPYRSCLQIRNRYYKFLEPVIKKVEMLAFSSQNAYQD